MAPSVEGKPRRLSCERLPPISSSSSPFSSRTIRSARSRYFGSRYVSHRSGGSRMWPSASTAPANESRWVSCSCFAMRRTLRPHGAKRPLDRSGVRTRVRALPRSGLSDEPPRVAAVDVPHERRIDVVAEQFLQPLRQLGHDLAWHRQQVVLLRPEPRSHVF